MNWARVGTLVTLVLLDLVWFEFVRHRLTDGGRFRTCEMELFVLSAHAVRKRHSFFKRERRFTLEAAP